MQQSSRADKMQKKEENRTREHFYVNFAIFVFFFAVVIVLFSKKATETTFKWRRRRIAKQFSLPFLAIRHL